MYKVIYVQYNIILVGLSLYFYTEILAPLEVIETVYFTTF